jgi:hypothetical protein
MPRKARTDYPGGVHHLIVRGIEWRRIFQDDQDRNAFLDRLGFLLPIKDAMIKTFCPINAAKGRRKRWTDLRGNVLKGDKNRMT